MKLPFRYQFILAPFTIVLLLAGLVAYTLIELSNINHEHEITRQWAIVTDRIQTAISTAVRLKQVIDGLLTTQDVQEDDHFFDYLEQTGILAGTLSDPLLLGHFPVDLRQKIARNELLLHEPERVNPNAISKFITDLLPDFEYQYKIIAAQRRTASIDNHLKLLALSTRMTTVLLTSLIVCIALATGLALWGLYVIRRRLKLLTTRSLALCEGGFTQVPEPTTSRDELDDLEIYLIKMTSRLLSTVSVENVLRGAENERRRIAMDMHDGVLADLTAVNRRLDKFEPGYSKNEIVALRRDVDDIINDLRCTIDDLHPQVLETLGLESALDSFLARRKVEIGFPHFHFEFDKRIEVALTIDHKINVFRIITEAINNVIKHAHCHRFEVCARVISPRLILTVEDDGVGYPEKKSAAGHGCSNMTERARLMGATVQWRVSRFATGTCFELSLALEQLE